MTWICQNETPEDMRLDRALPGVQPLEMSNWLHIDEVYAAQMRLRERLIDARLSQVHAVMPCAQQATIEALDLVLSQLCSVTGFTRSRDTMLCPDGRQVSLLDDPLLVLGRLIQEDICILQKPEDADEHILSAAILCFPAQWMLSEKIGHAMGRIHAPVDDYTPDIQKRVQRLFDGVKVGRPLWRHNNVHSGPQLFQPRSEARKPANVSKERALYQRQERQSLVRLPESDAIIFSIHTYVIAPQVE